eukprot:TRINITY_DN24569_c0_g1_i1.p2 TRINITY_DN24569_c0_g1~~TRINITY_DN24569_c0_g1_i1.p2  ORF type:complete len:226 (-),score=32.80 TRINITY_DN24569_c0_g1_i1:275-952(-)
MNVQQEEFSEKYKIGLLDNVYYINDFITQQEESWLMSELKQSKTKWTELSNRRLRNYGGIVHEKGLLPAPMPKWINQVIKKIADFKIFDEKHTPNHVLVNSYLPGEGILPHEDGPLYHPLVCIISMGSSCIIRFYNKNNNENNYNSQIPVQSVFLQPRSLLVFSERAYEECLHGILEVETERIDDSVANFQECGFQVGQDVEREGERISLTVRNVKKSLKSIIRL